MFHVRKFRVLRTSQMIAVGFAGLIFVGAVLLWMPFCTAKGETTAFTDAFFTAATSVCVTGLVTVQTSSHWSAAGKAVILLLIQAGGIGVISLAGIFFIGFHRKISLRSRRMIQESYHMDRPEGMVLLVRRIVCCVLCAEAVGAVCYSLCFIPRFGFAAGICQSVFTAVSAFCNAGIDLFGPDSLTPYVRNLPVNLITIGLVVVSGLGFLVWWDIAEKGKQILQGRLSAARAFRTLHFHSRVVLFTSAVLLLAGTVFIYALERANPETLGPLSGAEKWLAALFQSATTRTAGFYTIDQAGLSHACVIVCLFLMLVGGSPMGTAGGIKTTTLAVLLITAASYLVGKPDVECGGRRIRESDIRAAAAVTVVSLFALFGTALLLSALMPDAALTDVFYEAASAVGTVGLSRGLTGSLSQAGKWVVIFAMYLGRVGPLTMGTAVLLRARERSAGSRLAEEEIMVG